MVINGPVAIAGSIFFLCKNSGTNVPKVAANKIKYKFRVPDEAFAGMNALIQVTRLLNHCN